MPVHHVQSATCHKHGGLGCSSAYLSADQLWHFQHPLLRETALPTAISDLKETAFPKPGGLA